MQGYTTLNRPQSNMNPYLVKDILEATPQQLVIKLYDFAIVNCKKQDLKRTNNTLQALIDALNFEDERAFEISAGLLRLYKFCQEQMRKGNYSVIIKVLSELRESWIDAFNNS